MPIFDSGIFDSGIFRTDDPGYTITLTDSAGGLFSLEGADIKVAGALDYETATSHSISYRVTMADASFQDFSATINVTDVPDWWRADSSIDMDFINQRYYASGGEVSLSSLLSISRATQGTALKADDTDQVFAAGEFRITDRGLTIWDAATVGGVSEAADNIDPLGVLLNAIRGAEGMIVFEFEKTDMTGSNGFARLYHTGSASTHNRTLWLDVPGGTLTASTNDSGTGENVVASGTYTPGTIGKAGRAWKNGEVELICLNGGTVVQSAGVKIPSGTLSPNAIGRRGGDDTRYWRGRIRRITFWPTKPSEATLQARTA